MENNEEVKEFINLTFYMKSGNTIYVDKVLDSCRIFNNGGRGVREISGFIQHESALCKLHLDALDLSQIEAVTWSK